MAQTSECRQRHGAIIVAGGSVLSAGINRDRNHPRVLGDDSTIRLHASRHAEYVALQGLNHRVVTKGILYVARVNRAGEPMMSRPCNECWKHIQIHGIKEVVYTVGS